MTITRIRPGKTSRIVDTTPRRMTREPGPDASPREETLAVEYAALTDPELVSQAYLRARWADETPMTVTELEGLVALMNARRPKGYTGVHAR